jgi:hypothetical protein
MKDNLNCRFYRNEWPELEDLVVVSYTKIISNIIFESVFFIYRSKLEMSMRMVPMLNCLSTMTVKVLFLLQIQQEKE